MLKTSGSTWEEIQALFDTICATAATPSRPVFSMICTAVRNLPQSCVNDYLRIRKDTPAASCPFSLRFGITEDIFSENCVEPLQLKTVPVGLFLELVKRKEDLGATYPDLKGWLMNLSSSFKTVTPSKIQKLATKHKSILSIVRKMLDSSAKTIARETVLNASCSAEGSSVPL